MNRAARLVFVAAGVALVLGTLATRGAVLTAMQVPGLVLVSGLIATGLCASFGPGMTLDALRDLIRQDATPRERAMFALLWNRAHSLAWGSAVLATLCSLTLLLTNLDQPDRALPSVGMCLMPLIWGGLFAELLFAPFAAWAERALPRNVASEPPH